MRECELAGCFNSERIDFWLFCFLHNQNHMPLSLHCSSYDCVCVRVCVSGCVCVCPCQSWCPCCKETRCELAGRKCVTEGPGRLYTLSVRPDAPRLFGHTEPPPLPGAARRRGAVCFCLACSVFSTRLDCSPIR